MLEPAKHPGIAIAVAAIRSGGVVAYPTEAVYGLGCDPNDREACERIFELKQRTPDMGLILIASQIGQFEQFLVDLSDAQGATLQSSWPGPITWLVPDNGVAPNWITGGQGTLALRVTDHPVAAALCESFGGPLVSTSANPHGHPPARSADDVSAYFGETLAAILDGPLGELTQPTEIRDLVTQEIIRPA